MGFCKIGQKDSNGWCQLNNKMCWHIMGSCKSWQPSIKIGTPATWPEPMPEDAECRKDPKSRYYSEGGMEVLEIIKAKLTPEQFRGYLLGNIIKYGCRANFKDDFGRDVEKINFYSGYLKGGE